MSHDNDITIVSALNRFAAGSSAFSSEMFGATYTLDAKFHKNLSIRGISRYVHR